jgi:hypothetical protein
MVSLGVVQDVGRKNIEFSAIDDLILVKTSL